MRSVRQNALEAELCCDVGVAGDTCGSIPGCRDTIYLYSHQQVLCRRCVFTWDYGTLILNKQGFFIYGITLLCDSFLFLGVEEEWISNQVVPFWLQRPAYSLRGTGEELWATVGAQIDHYQKIRVTFDLVSQILFVCAKLV